MTKFLKFLNIVGYISLLQIIYFGFMFFLSYDIILQLMSIAILISLMNITRKVLRKIEYKGIKCLFFISIFFIITNITYDVYTIYRGNAFKNEIISIYDESNNTILNSSQFSSYKCKYIPDKLIIDHVSKGGGQKGYITMRTYNEPQEIIYSNMLGQIIIIYKNNRYYLTETY